MSDTPAIPKRILVVAHDTATEQSLLDVIRSCAEGFDAEVLVIASESALEACVAHLRGSGMQVRGRVGPADPLEAVSDGLAGFAADEIVLATAARRWPFWPSRNLVERVRGRFAGTIFHVVLDPLPKPSPRLGTPLPLPVLSERR